MVESGLQTATWGGRGGGRLRVSAAAFLLAGRSGWLSVGGGPARPDRRESPGPGEA